MNTEASDDARAMTPAPGEEVSCALALVNTRQVRGGKPVDLIADAPGASRWLADRALIPAGNRVTDGAAAGLRTLRESIRDLFAARAQASVPVASDVALLNAALSAAAPIPGLTWDTSGPGRGEQAPATDAAAVALGRLAYDALAVLTDSGGPELALCGAHGCVRWFLRTHAARQWCSTRCGDRVRAARHYARHHP